MADESDRTSTTTEPKGDQPVARHRTTRLPRPRAGALAAGRRRAVNLLAGLVSLVTTLVVIVLAIHIVFVAFEANGANDLVSTVRDWADDLAWEFRDVFKPEDHKAEVAVNYGLAAVVYLIIGRIVVSLIRRLG
ncbi:hypothetical protein [Spirillospora sp. CA-294931]|uniref:hypothetical protein n=1 Tax=Spirillospora sp. CA-294931 TaxID=3240042 RepID=UPI003D8B61E2